MAQVAVAKVQLLGHLWCFEREKGDELHHWVVHSEKELKEVMEESKLPAELKQKLTFEHHPIYVLVYAIKSGSNQMGCTSFSLDKKGTLRLFLTYFNQPGCASAAETSGQVLVFQINENSLQKVEMYMVFKFDLLKESEYLLKNVDSNVAFKQVFGRLMGPNLLPAIVSE